VEPERSLRHSQHPTSPYSELNESNPYPKPYFPNTNCIIILPSTPRSSELSLPFRFPYKYIARISHLSHARYIPCQAHPHLFNNYNNILWNVHITELLMMQFKWTDSPTMDFPDVCLEALWLQEWEWVLEDCHKRSCWKNSIGVSVPRPYWSDLYVCSESCRLCLTVVYRLLECYKVPSWIEQPEYVTLYKESFEKSAWKSTLWTNTAKHVNNYKFYYVCMKYQTWSI
jgi:hypothetical protein